MVCVIYLQFAMCYTIYYVYFIERFVNGSLQVQY